MTCRRWRAFIGTEKLLYGIDTSNESPACRDGQRRPVFIYRLLSTGTIDGGHMSTPLDQQADALAEKIFQRQVTKVGLSDCE